MTTWSGKLTTEGTGFREFAYALEEEQTQERFEQVRDAVAKTLTEQAEKLGEDPREELDSLGLLYDLAGAETVDEFDTYWDRLYDWADEWRIWVELA